MFVEANPGPADADQGWLHGASRWDPGLHPCSPGVSLANRAGFLAQVERVRLERDQVQAKRRIEQNRDRLMRQRLSKPCEIVPHPTSGTFARLRDDLIDWLDQLRHWEAFATWTWDGRWGDTGPSPRRAVELVEEFLVEMDIAYCWWCIERGKLGRVHAHGLLNGQGSLGFEVQRNELWQAWFHRFGRNRVEPIDDSMPVSYYISKYVVKDLRDGNRWGSLQWGLHG